MRVCRGKVYRLGRHRLLVGDGTDPASLRRLLGARRADMVLADPPYAVAYEGGPKPGKDRNGGMIGDALGAVDWQGFIMRLAAACKAACPEGDVYCWRSGAGEGDALAAAFEAEGLHRAGDILWSKHHFAISRGNYHRRHERMLYGWFGRSSYRGGRAQSDLWEHPKPARSPLHPTSKPLPLCARAILNSSPEGGAVFDPCAGGGSVMIACETLGRSCFAAEIDPRHARTLVRRWEGMTGGTAKEA